MYIPPPIIGCSGLDNIVTPESKWMKQMYPVGHRFWYMGREMIVIYNTGSRIYTQYSDNHGVIQNWECDNCDLLKSIL